MLPTDISRRGFIKGLGLCGAGLALGVTLPGMASAARGAAPREHSETRLMMGTVVSITVARTSRLQADDGMGLAFAEMERLVGIFDRHQSATPLGVLNASGRLNDAPAELVAVLQQARAYGRLTDTAFEVTIQPVLDLLAARSNPAGSMSLRPEELEAALELVDPEGVRMAGRDIRLARAGMGVTLDGIAKGHIVDQAARMLEGKGIRHYLINAGGDIRCGGEKRPGVAWTIAVEDPTKSGAYPATLNLRNGAVATSGSYERYFDKSREHHHLIEPHTGISPAAHLSVTVKAPTTMEADVLATAFSVMPQQQAMRLVDSMPGRACLFVQRDGLLVTSADWNKA